MPLQKYLNQEGEICSWCYNDIKTMHGELCVASFFILVTIVCVIIL